VVLYAAMYAAFGVASPFFPAFLESRGATAAELGVILALGTSARLLASPIAGRLGDALQNLRAVLVACAVLAVLATAAYVPAQGFWALLPVYVAHAAALAPLTVLADALSVRQRFEYGWVRGTGSAAFIAATLLSGQAVSVLGLQAILWLQASLLVVAAFAASRVAQLPHRAAAPAGRGAVLALLRLPAFRYLVLVAAIVLGSHAMHDAFAMIRWRAAGVSPGLASLLWSEAVAAEVLVFFVVGPALVTRLSPAGALALAALAAALRWAVMAQSAEVVALALVQPLHGITFALLHLACMRLILRVVPPGLEGTAQAIYGTVGIGAATALLTLLSGSLYGSIGAQGFWVMAALCLLALPLAWKLRD
jgi:PPP family 3-phenylpropionic acid transporter